MFTELVELLRKLHETFIALAAQLHQVHEAVKVRGTNAICTHIIEIIMCYQYIAQILNLLLLQFISVNKDLFATITSQFTWGKLVSGNYFFLAIEPLFVIFNTYIRLNEGMHDNKYSG